jgi:hypothetical protein
MVAIIIGFYAASPGIWQVVFDLPLAGVNGAVSTQPAATGAQACAQAASGLSARGFHIIA